MMMDRSSGRPPMRLTLQHLRCLLALADCGSLTAAAEQLRLTQSALSHQIAGMERHFEIRLFQRKSRPLRFTLAGERLLELARAVVPRIEECEASLQRIGQGLAGRLHIAIECHSCFQWLMPTLDHYREQWPEVELDLTLAHGFEPLPALRAGRVDLVVTSDPMADAELIFQPLFSYPILLIVATDHPLATREWVAPDDLTDERLITYPVETTRLDLFSRFLTPAGVLPAAVRHVELTPMIVQLVASGRGIASLPAWAWHEYRDNPRIRALRLGRDGVRATLFAAVRRDMARQDYLRAFVARARETCFETLEGIERAADVPTIR